MSDTDVTDEAEETTDEVVEPERATRYDVPVETDGEWPVLYPTAEQWFDLAVAMLADGFTMCVDLTAVDYLTYSVARPLPSDVVGERFEVVAIFWNLEENTRLRARVQVPADAPALPTIGQIYPGVDYLEREMFDMFGIEFTDHPDLSRILMPETWQGHPLRKDYETGSIPVQFKGAPGPR